VSLAIQELASRIERLSREDLLLLSPEDAAQLDWTLQDARCAEPVASFESGPLYWLTNLTKTCNPQYESQGLPLRAPFPRKEYFVPLFAAFLKRYERLFIPKSRTMLSSLSALGFATWDAQWNGAETLVQTLNMDRCTHFISMAREYWENQEPFLKARHPLSRNSLFEVAWKGGGSVAAIPSGVDQARGFHSTTYVQDESAFLPEGEECLAAVMPSGARIICISSAAPGWFADQCSR
jgi:hypothetical protein